MTERMDHADLRNRLQKLNAIGIALSAQTDIAQLIEMILNTARELVNADAGTVYLQRDDQLQFELVMTGSRNLHWGGTSPIRAHIPALPLKLADGQPNLANVAAAAVNLDKTINIADAYTAEGYDFSGTRQFDERLGYRSRSFLSVPLRNHDGAALGVLQLINAQDEDGNSIAFSVDDQQLVESLASQAAIAINNRQLINALEELFEAFIGIINMAIDDKSPYTSAHCQRVPELTLMLADAVCQADYGPLAGFAMSAADRYELKIAGLLHDCGKITTPVHVVDKATKLQTIFDRIDLIDTRFEVLLRDAEIAHLKGEMDLASWQQTREQIHADRAFLRHTNRGVEAMSDADIARVQAIAQRTLSVDGQRLALLSADEAENLSVRRGTLTRAERDIINHHIDVTIQMLASLPWPRHLQRVPEFAGGHHERMDGKGYPLGLTREQMSVQARIMGLADVFEALTAKDRPYKQGMPLSQALAIMARMARDQHIDADLYEVFLRQQVWLAYAQQFLDADQVDAVDTASLLALARSPRPQPS
ncbi:HD domain-containing phosphohydrolase [Amantichitinum ursilacus]|uniref:Cyclic di-GMP phosphodiesterase response regulator RpfG n=1 Tax=Amantichitinum ursilacus TaxID=857265 RepID=A0A0N0XK11_9NEIS|nr:HD domain-containing phosphohydrolase [Amantichitinum ursilacus]KPC54136.1 Cyclic di-GMP phosphodiesterase response regulator RpfG [Amantichitinum ursilacus]